MKGWCERMNYNNIDIVDIVETGLLVFTAFYAVVIMNMLVVFN